MSIGYITQYFPGLNSMESDQSLRIPYVCHASRAGNPDYRYDIGPHLTESNLYSKRKYKRYKSINTADETQSFHPSPSTLSLDRNRTNSIHYTSTTKTMKLLSLAVFLFPITTLSTPISTDTTAVLPRNAITARDVWCSNVSGRTQGCDLPAGTRSRAVSAGSQFGVQCKRHGPGVSGPGGTNYVWDYVPGWDCYISARWTNSDCEGEFIPMISDFWTCVVRIVKMLM